jgi:hypothetical protein
MAAISRGNEMESLFSYLLFITLCHYPHLILRDEWCGGRGEKKKEKPRHTLDHHCSTTVPPFICSLAVNERFGRDSEEVVIKSPGT